MEHQEERESNIKNTDLQQGMVIRNQLVKGKIDTIEANRRIAKFNLII